MNKVTSYTNIIVANWATREVIEQNKDAIIQWYRGGKSESKEFTANLGREVGYGLRRGASNLKPRSGAEVLLKKMSDGSIKIITSFPI